MYRKYKIKLRRSNIFKVKPEAEQLDNQVFEFSIGWVIKDTDTSLPIVGEIAMIPRYNSKSPEAPSWIASGDLEVIL